jgi:hypothetical protein
MSDQVSFSYAYEAALLDALVNEGSHLKVCGPFLFSFFLLLLLIAWGHLSNSFFPYFSLSHRHFALPAP